MLPVGGVRASDIARAGPHSSGWAGAIWPWAVVPSLEGLRGRLPSWAAPSLTSAAVRALTTAFCAARPAGVVVGIDVLVERWTWHATARPAGAAEAGRAALQAVEELNDTDRFDLAWLPSPFIASQVIATALDRMHATLHPGGSIVVAARPFLRSGLPPITRWKTYRAAGPALSARRCRTTTSRRRLRRHPAIPTPPGAPAVFPVSPCRMTASQRRQRQGRPSKLRGVLHRVVIASRRPSSSCRRACVVARLSERADDWHPCC